MTSNLSGSIGTGFEGFNTLINMYHAIDSGILSSDELLVDMTNATWFDANLCALLGAILYPWRMQGKGIKIRTDGQKNPGIKDIFQRNGFIRKISEEQSGIVDDETAIQFHRFEKEDMPKFTEYIVSHFVGGKRGIPFMSNLLQQNFRESIAEIFTNAQQHSDTKEGIFVCGQYFPHKKRLDFSIADRGVGIKNNVNSRKGLCFSAEEAIAWAMSGANSTKRISEGKSGGNGLKLIKDFIGKNNGKIHIVSDSGYWCFENGSVKMRSFEKPFMGTFVNIEINTSDTQAYRLSSEQQFAKDNIF